MTKFLALICILFGLAAASSDTCIYTAALKTVYGFSGDSISMVSPQAYSNLKYCTSLKSGACCTDTDINNIAALSDAFTKNLTTLVSDRDTYITTVKNTVLPTLLTNIQNYNKVAGQFMTAFENQMGTVLNGVDLSDLGDSEFDDSEFNDSDIDESEADDISTALSLYSIVESFSYLTNITTQFVSNVDSIKSNYVNYQNARRTCVLDMLDIQNSAMCLSCDPSASSKGFVDLTMDLEGASDDWSDESDPEFDQEDETDEEESAWGFGIDMSTATCNRLQSSCKPYVALAVGQNQLIEVVSASSAFSSLTTAMQSFIDGKFDDAMTEFNAVIDATVSEANPAPALIGSELPENCDTNGNCEWICEGMFDAGIVDPLTLLVGGRPSLDIDGEDDSSPGRRLLAQNRNLDNGQWAPTKGDSGVTVTFAADPANTDTNSGKKFGTLNLGNVFVGMMVVISSMLLL